MAGDLSYPSTLGNSENPAWIQFAFFERKSPKGSNPSDKISLYMPEAISQPSTVSWDTEKFGFIGNAIAQGGGAALEKFRSGGNPLEIAQAGGFGTGTQLVGGLDLMTGYSLANLGSAAAQLMGGSVSAEALMGEVAGKVPNPYLTMVFRGIDFRNFAFVFKFYPFSESDCVVIDNIIKSFRRNQLPDYDSGKAFLTYPSECEISYHWGQDENPWLHKFKRSVCTAVDVDYTGAGMFSPMRNGFPGEITVSTKWSEIELVTRSDVDEGY